MTTDGDEDKTKARKGLRVASRAIRRGRKLRPSLLPGAPVETDGTAEDEPLSGQEKDDFGAVEPSIGEDEIAPSLSFWNEPRPESSDSPFDAPSMSDRFDAAHEDDEEPLPLSRPAGADELRAPAKPRDGATSGESPKIEIHESAYPGDSASALDEPSIRVKESSAPADLDDALSRSPRFSRPAAPSFALGSAPKTREAKPIPRLDETPESERDAGDDDEAPFSEAPFSEAPFSEAPFSEAPSSEAPSSEAPFSENDAGDDDAAPSSDHARSVWGVDPMTRTAASSITARQSALDSDRPRPSEHRRDSEAPPSSRRSSGDDFRPLVGAENRRSIGVPFAVGLVVLAAVAGGLWVKRSVVKSSVRARPAPSATATPTAVSAVTSTKAAATTSPPAASIEPTASPDASAAPSASASSDESTSSEDFDALRREFVDLHSKRKLKESEEIARKLVALRPNDATGYRCLGAALQDQGRMREAKATYSDCVSSASEGDVAECAQLGGTLRSVKD